MKIIINKTFVVLSLIFLALPFLINLLSCIDAPFVSWRIPSNWTVFWGQYLSGFAAFAMLYVAWRTLITTKEANRPFIAVDIINDGYSHAFIRCRNIGNSTASNIQISLDNKFIEQIKLSKVKESLEVINSTKPFFLEPKGEKLWEVFLIPGTHLDSFHGVWGADAKYPFKGQYISKKEWQENETIFRSTICKCHVSYNNEYEDSFNLDYNNILFGISDAQLISSYLNSIMTQLYRINETLVTITKSNNGTKQDK